MFKITHGNKLWQPEQSRWITLTETFDIQGENIINLFKNLEHMSHPLLKSQAYVLSDSWRSVCWSTTFFFSLATDRGNGNTMIASHHVELILTLWTLNSRIVFPDFSLGSDGYYIAMSDFWSFHPNRDPSPRPKTPAIRWVLGQRNIEMKENRVQPRRKFWVDIGYMIYCTLVNK